MGARVSDQWLEWVRQGGSWIGLLGAALALVGGLATFLASNEKERRAHAASDLERSARQELQSRIEPRVLTQPQIEATLAMLTPAAKVDGAETPRQVAVFPTSSGFESARLADQLAGVFAAAGWSVNRHSVHYGKPLAVSGIGILAANHPLGGEGADQILAALHHVGLAAFRLSDREASDRPNALLFNTAISIFVGDKL